MVIPVFNSEKYLRRCIDSIICQTYANIEVILVDDGSCDSSPIICDEYAERDSRIKAMHKNNGGVSSARNVGIHSAIGRYICFVDSDDYLREDGLEKMYKAVKSTGAEWCIGGIERWKPSVQGKEVIDKEDCPQKILELLTRKESYASWAKLFDLTLLNKFCIRFNEEQTCSEDTVFNREYLSRINRVVTITDVVYICDPSNPYSLSKKGHAHYAEYRIIKLNVLRKICDRLDIDDDKKEQFLACRATHSLRISMQHYIRCWHDEQIQRKYIENSVNTLLPWLDFSSNINPYMSPELARWWKRNKRFIVCKHYDKLYLNAKVEYVQTRVYTEIRASIGKIVCLVRNIITTENRQA